ncbi:MAG TPA: DNA-directed RNA polymerase subunit D [Methanomicrobiales archaeon]|nr:DNA-directed RNA polymerase subunit D [Methanomicrobiales archaeon]
MEIAFSKLDENAAYFVLSDATTAFANTLRRTMIGEVPTLAIEDVSIYDNNSVLFDEIIAHRLGLIPLKTDLTVYVPQKDCACQGAGCPACMATYTLSAEGPKTVLSGDLIPADPNAAPADPNIPIVELSADQKLVLEARAVVNVGREHAKWQSIVACGYKMYPIITISENCDSCGMCVDECPRGVLQVGPSRKVEVGNAAECSLCRLCEQVCLSGAIGAESAVHISMDKTRYLFVVESDGSMPAQEIVRRALEHIRDKATSTAEMLNEVYGGTLNE